jgi:hypothetical protein
MKNTVRNTVRCLWAQTIIGVYIDTSRIFVCLSPQILLVGNRHEDGVWNERPHKTIDVQKFTNRSFMTVDCDL